MAAAGLNPDQALALEHDAFQPIRWFSRWERFFLLATGILGSTIILKLAAIQYLELLYLFQIFVIFLHFIRDDLRTVWFRPFLWLFSGYFVFMVAALALAVASLRFAFYIPIGLPWFIYPVYITVSRVVEFLASTYILLWLADLFRKDPAKLRMTMRVFFWTGVASTIFSYLSIPGQALGIPYTTGVYLDTGRFRGFYNEGGPYGLYLLTVIFVGLALYQLRWEPVKRMRIGLAFLPIAFYKSYSKAAFTAVILLLLINGIFTRGLAKRLVLLGGMALVIAIGARNLNLVQLLSVVDSNSAAYERESHLHAYDGNFVYGRVAARFIVPRMIAAHPYTGIGWGNYGILRNDPQYRGASVWSDIADQPGLGVLGYAAELGLPLLSFLAILLVLPYFWLRLRGAPTWITNLALMSPLVHICGAQLNVTYPWIVTAFALGLGYAATAQPTPHPAAESLQLSWNREPDSLGAHS